MIADASTLSIAVFETELGWVAALGRGNSLWQLTFGHATVQAAVIAIQQLAPGAKVNEAWRPRWIARLRDYAAGQRVDLSGIPLEVGRLTAFQQRVLQRCREIPYGQTMTYGELAAAVGAPGAARAVGSVMARNCIPLVIPCHRVIPSSGRLGGYSAEGGTRMKLRLLEAEGLPPGRLRAATPVTVTA